MKDLPNRISNLLRSNRLALVVRSKAHSRVIINGYKGELCLVSSHEHHLAIPIVSMMILEHNTFREYSRDFLDNNAKVVYLISQNQTPHEAILSSTILSLWIIFPDWDRERIIEKSLELKLSSMNSLADLFCESFILWGLGHDTNYGLVKLASKNHPV